MDLLKRELEKKKKAIALAKEKSGAGFQRGGRTFLNAGDLRRFQEEHEDDRHSSQRQPQRDVGDGIPFYRTMPEQRLNLELIQRMERQTTFALCFACHVSFPLFRLRLAPPFGRCRP